MWALLRGSPLAFPNRRPGFDPTHPASKGMAPGNSFSAVAVGNNYVNLLTGGSATFPAGVGSAPLAAIDGNLGPAVDGVGQTGSSGNSPQFTFTPAISGNITYAVMVRPKNSGNGSYQILGIGGGDEPQFAMIDNGSGTAFTLAFYTGWTSAFSLQYGVPYFIVGSVDFNTSTTNIVATDLRTGRIYTSSGYGTYAGGGTTGWQIGNRADNSNQAGNSRISHAMLNLSYFQMSALVSWAAEPWLFWYPLGVLHSLDWLGAAGGSGTAVTIDFGSAIELLSSARRDGLIAGEVLASLSRDAAVNDEFLTGATRDCLAPGEFLLGMTRDAAMPVESIGNLRVDQVAALEQTALVRGDFVTADEMLASVRRDLAAPAEALRSVAADSAVTLENLGGLVVTADARVALETLAAVRSDAVVAAEALAAFVTDAGLLDEFLASHSVTSDTRMVLEILSSVASQQPIPHEFSGLAQLAIEWIIRARRRGRR